jgi:endonuclease/exonuclease/phosphatase family metal-dependent hydrolase
MQRRNVRIATFNCEWRRTKSADANLIRTRAFDTDVDVVCLTETHQDFLQEQGFCISSAPFNTGANPESRRKVLLWSRNPWESVDIAGPSGIPEGRYVAGTTLTRLGELTFIGVCIPYRWAGVQYDLPKREPWELHLTYLAALDQSLPMNPARTVLLGDFNQRVPRKYQPQRIFDELDRVILRRFSIATSGPVPDIERQAIDHVCHSHDLISKSTAGLSNARPDGGKISDHFGVRVELTSAT